MAGTLKVKIQEDIILDNQDYGSKRVFEISSIANITKKIVSIAGDDDATVLVFKSTTAIADGALDLQTVKYIRITNLDSSNSVNVSLQLDSGEDNSAADLSVTHLLEAGRSFGDSTVPEVQRIGGHIINKYQPQFTSQAVSDKKTQDQYFKLTEHDFTTSVREDEKLGLGLRDFSYPPTIGPETEELVGMELSQIEGPDFLSRLKTYKTEKETEQEQMKQLFGMTVLIQIIENKLFLY